MLTWHPKINFMTQFGKWTVTADGIEKGSPNKYHILRNVLGQEGQGDREGMYDWLIHISQKTWMAPEDVNDLCKAFEFAMGNDLSPEMYKATLIELKDIVNEKGLSDDDDEITIGIAR